MCAKELALFPEGRRRYPKILRREFTIGDYIGGE
jgi:hypothetical protein